MKSFLFAISAIFTGLFIGFLVVGTTSCSKRPNEKEHYINEYFIIKEKGGFAERNGKYTNVGKYFLIQRIADTTEFTELNGNNFGPLGEYYGSSLYYNKQEGDTLYFEYILKSRFFRVAGGYYKPYKSDLQKKSEHSEAISKINDMALGCILN